jgi:hypothetical protein
MPYRIRETRYYYQPRGTETRDYHDPETDLERWPTRADALALISTLEAAQVAWPELPHGEHALRTYRIAYCKG